MTPIERKKKVMQWQAPRSVVNMIRYTLMLVCAIIVFTIGNYGEDATNESVHLLSQG